MPELQIIVYSENYPEKHYIRIINNANGKLVFEDIDFPVSIPISGEAHLIINKEQIGNLIEKLSSIVFHDRLALHIIGRMSRLKRGHNSLHIEWSDVMSLEPPAVLLIDFECHQGQDYRTLNHVFLAGVDGIKIAVQITNNVFHDHHYDQVDFQKDAERKYNASPSMVIVVSHKDFI